MTDKTIQVEINGFRETVPADSTVQSLIELYKEGDVDLIVELNGRFIYPQQYAGTRISENDRIEFINPNFGG